MLFCYLYVLLHCECFLLLVYVNFLAAGAVPELRVVTTQQQKSVLTGSIYQVLATLAVLAEGLLTQASD